MTAYGRAVEHVTVEDDDLGPKCLGELHEGPPRRRLLARPEVRICTYEDNAVLNLILKAFGMRAGIGGGARAGSDKAYLVPLLEPATALHDVAFRQVATSCHFGRADFMEELDEVGIRDFRVAARHQLTPR